jgi:replicative DNA helicase
MRNANYQTAADVFDGWRDDVLTGEPPKLYPVGGGDLARIEIGPKLVTLIGGAPGAGKTAFTMQCVIDALRLTDTLRVLVCNIEMPPTVLLDRQLARLSGIDVATIRYRQLDGSHAERLDQAMNTLESVSDRLFFVRPPFNLANVAAAADACNADLLVLDYIQRIPPPGEHGDRRSSVDATMNYLREFADTGVGVIVVAAVARQKDNRGRSSYASESLSLASFRESSELEFGADDAFILSPDQNSADVVVLRHLKARHTEPRDMKLQFDRRRQQFTPAKPIDEPKPDGKLQSALAAIWEGTESAPDTETEIEGE